MGGVGNLAAELADAWDDDDEYYDGAAPDINFDLEPGQDVPAHIGLTDGSDVDAFHNCNLQNLQTRDRNGALTLPSPNNRSHRRMGSEYDGSEYGSDSDLDSPGMPSSLVAKIDAVEALARRGTERGSEHAEGVFRRVVDGLRDLGSQSNVEGNATRLITAHSAIGTHINYQNRQFHNLAYSVCNPLQPPPNEETVDALIPLLASLSDSMPRPVTLAYDQLAALHTITADLVQTLSYMSDTLHMTRQTTTTAARRLKSARELVLELKREEELCAQGQQWLEKGNWGERLRKRECAHVCGEVVGGFEEVCNNIRAQMVAQAKSQA